MLGLRPRAVGIVGEVGERMVMVLKERIGVAGEGVVPATGEPGPGDVRVGQTVADVRQRLVGHQMVGSGRRGVGGIYGVGGVEGIAVRRDVLILQVIWVIGEGNRDGVLGGVRPRRRAGADEPE